MLTIILMCYPFLMVISYLVDKGMEKRYGIKARWTKTMRFYALLRAIFVPWLILPLAFIGVLILEIPPLFKKASRKIMDKFGGDKPANW